MEKVNDKHAFRGAQFTLAAQHFKQIPADAGYEVAFAGRSNSGKSSAINALTGIRSLARTSKTPGRTQQIVFFTVDEQHRLVDLPGYGYAKVPPSVKQHWHNLLEKYFTKRESLKGLILVMDIRHPLTEFDQQMLHWCQATTTPTHILLTKADKLSRGTALSQHQKVQNSLVNIEHLVSAQVFSAPSRQGVNQVIDKLNQWMEYPSRTAEQVKK